MNEKLTRPLTANAGHASRLPGQPDVAPEARVADVLHHEHVVAALPRGGEPDWQPGERAPHLVVGNPLNRGEISGRQDAAELRRAERHVVEPERGIHLGSSRVAHERRNRERGGGQQHNADDHALPGEAAHAFTIHLRRPPVKVRYAGPGAEGE